MENEDTLRDGFYVNAVSAHGYFTCCVPEAQRATNLTAVLSRWCAAESAVHGRTVCSFSG